MNKSTLFPDGPHPPPSFARAPDFGAALQGIDLVAAIAHFKNKAAWQCGKQEGQVLLESASLRIVLMGLKANAMCKARKADCIQRIQLLEGKVSFITDLKQLMLAPSQVFVLEAHAQHHVVALEDSFYLLIMVLNTAEVSKRKMLAKIAL